MKSSPTDKIMPLATKTGILGAGQLGKMLALEAARWDLELYLLDKSPDFPAAPYCKHFRTGDFKNYEDVLAFGGQLDVIGIEIEGVNTEALRQLEKEGKIIHPAPDKLEIIQDKARQKSFFRLHGLPTCFFEIFPDANAIREAVQSQKLSLPFVQKSRTEGYDGRGVKVVRQQADLDDLLETPSIVEEAVPILKELAVITARNARGEVKSYPVVEMAFSPEANLVEYLFAPASVDPEVATRAIEIAEASIKAFDICGLLAVEFFLTQSGELLINEVAPRTHNSGHHTLESAETSQFEQHLRTLLNLPLGSTRLLCPAVMVNVLGEPGHVGSPVYQGLEQILAMPGVHLHLYGKKETRPFRKMGHVTVTAETLVEATKRAKKVQQILKVTAG